MRSRLLPLGLAIAALAVPGSAHAATPCADATLMPTATNATEVERATVCLVNRERTSRGLRSLKAIPALESVAGAYAKRMAREDFFDHSSPDGSTFLTRIKRTSYLGGGLRRWSVGENIAWGSGSLATPRSIVRAWMRSPGHRRNILNGSYNELGLGVAHGAPTQGAGSAPAATYVNEFGERRR